MEDVGYGEKIENNCTRLALSIIPTNINIDDIEKVFNFAIKYNISPSIGELGKAGSAIENQRFDKLDIRNKIKNLKAKMDELWNGSYCRPMCPVILTGLHINHIGECTVDCETGLNCKWFIIREAKMSRIASIREETIGSIFRKVEKNKLDLFKKNIQSINEYGSVDHLFGGCGGSPKNVISLAKSQLKYAEKNSI